MAALRWRSTSVSRSTIRPTTRSIWRLRSLSGRPQLCRRTLPFFDPSGPIQTRLSLAWGFRSRVGRGRGAGRPEGQRDRPCGRQAPAIPTRPGIVKKERGHEGRDHQVGRGRADARGRFLETRTRGRDRRPKFRAVKARAAQSRPKDFLGARHLLSQGASELMALRFRLSVPSPLTPLPSGEGLPPPLHPPAARIAAWRSGSWPTRTLDAIPASRSSALPTRTRVSVDRAGMPPRQLSRGRALLPPL